MKKRRITLNLDEDLVDALEAVSAGSVSAAANTALREGVAFQAHRAAMLRWLDGLDADHGRATSDEAAAVEALLDQAGARAAHADAL